MPPLPGLPALFIIWLFMVKAGLRTAGLVSPLPGNHEILKVIQLKSLLASHSPPQLKVMQILCWFIYSQERTELHQPLAEVFLQSLLVA